MLNILVTGSKGFIGKNLLKKLTLLENINILEFNRNDTEIYLEECISKSDFYVFKSGNEFIIFRTSQLKKYCFSCNHKQASINNAAFFLINKEILLKNVNHYIIKIK